MKRLYPRVGGFVGLVNGRRLFRRHSFDRGRHGLSQLGNRLDGGICSFANWVAKDGTNGSQKARRCRTSGSHSKCKILRGECSVEDAE